MVAKPEAKAPVNSTPSPTTAFSSVTTGRALASRAKTDELKALYPNDMELVSSTTNAWIDMIDSQFTVNAVWNLRTKDLLGAI